MKIIEKLLSKGKESEESDNNNRPEAMTLEEMAVKSQERKILGAERKIDMNIIVFVALCLCGLVVINFVLYFLISESKSDMHQPTVMTQDARGLLKERREERQALSSFEQSGTELTAVEDRQNGIVEALEIVEEFSEAESNLPDLDASAEQSNLESIDTAAEPIAEIAQEIAETNLDELVEVSDPEPQIIAEDVSLIEDTRLADNVAESDQLQGEAEQPEQEEIPFDLVISVGATINDWSNAWSAQDVEAYLSYYADTFVSEAGMNIEEWRAHRAIRLTKPEWISIGISKLKINAMDDGGARAEFVQEYNASNYSDKELKKMIFREVDGDWRIFDERATPVK